MFIVKGRLLGTIVALAIAALGALLLSRSPAAADAGCGPTPDAVATVAAVAGR
jgi:hypothetical protein